MSLSGFEKESDIEERRKLRQSEWEKVRTADQPESKNLIKLRLQKTLKTSIT